jgi:hypothetical protein
MWHKQDMRNASKILVGKCKWEEIAWEDLSVDKIILE